MAISDPVLVGSFVLDSNATTIDCTTSGTVPAGAKVWVATGFFPFPVDSTRSLSSVSDNGAGLSYTVDVTGQNSVNTGCAIASADAPSGLASGTVVEATFSGSCGDRSIAVFYSTGVATGTGAAYGAIGHDDDGTTAWASGAVSLTSGDILIGASHFEDSTASTSIPSGGNTEICDLGSPASGSGFTATYQKSSGSLQAQGTWSQTSSGTVGTRSCAVGYTAGTSGIEKAGAGIVGP